MKTDKTIFAAMLCLSVSAASLFTSGTVIQNAVAQNTVSHTSIEVAAISNTDLLQAQALFRRLTGVPLLPADPRLKQMAILMSQGQAQKAAAIATDDPNFLQVTVKNLAAKISSRSETPFIFLDDFQATFIGTVADELDARLLLSGDYIYRGKNGSTVPSRRDNQHYEEIDLNHLEYKSTLVKQDSQWLGELSNHAGLMTTRAWGWNYDAGTNRRAVVNAFDRFLCKPIAEWKVPNLEEKTVGRDVDRWPGKKPQVFQNQCLTCHGGMDPMRDAFARFEIF